MARPSITSGPRVELTPGAALQEAQHCWVLSTRESRRPALLLAWRKTYLPRAWEGLAVTSETTPSAQSMVTRWRHQADLSPAAVVTDGSLLPLAPGPALRDGVHC